MCRYKNGKLISSKNSSRFKVQQNSLQIRDVCKQDAGEYMLVLKNSPAALEKRLNFTLIVNGNNLLYEINFLSLYEHLI